MECGKVPDFHETCAELLSVNACRLVDYDRFMRDEDILLLKARSALRAVQCACERHRECACTFLARHFGIGSVGLKYGIAYRANCYFVFRWVPSEVNYSDRGSRFYDADPCECFLNRLRLLQRQSMSSAVPHQAPFKSLVCTSPCHHMTVRLVNLIDQGITSETPVSRVPQSTVSVIDHQSDTTETPVSCVDQVSVSAADCISVFPDGFSGEQVLESWPILFGPADVSRSVRLLRECRRHWSAIAIITSVA